jgi:hypothetical protein
MASRLEKRDIVPVRPRRSAHHPPLLCAFYSSPLALPFLVASPGFLLSEIEAFRAFRLPFRRARMNLLVDCCTRIVTARPKKILAIANKLFTAGWGSPVKALPTCGPVAAVASGASPSHALRAHPSVSSKPENLSQTKPGRHNPTVLNR